MAVSVALGPVRWFVGVLRCRFDFDRQVAMRPAGQLGSSSEETLIRSRAAVDSTTSPPPPRRVLLGEVMHVTDIRRPSGTDHGTDRDADRMRPV